MNSPEFEPIGTERRDVYEASSRIRELMSRAYSPLLAVLGGLWLVVVLSALATSGGAPTDHQPVDFETPAQTNETDDKDGRGGADIRLAGLIAVQNESIRGAVRRESVRARLNATGSPAERAAVVDSQVRSIDRRVTALERRLSTRTASPDGLSGTARRAEIGATARVLNQSLAESDRAASALPQAVRTERNLTARIDSLTSRVTQLRRETRTATRTVTGAGQPTRVDPLTSADVGAVIDKLSSAIEDSSRFNPVGGSRVLDIRVRTANGSTLRVGVTVEGESVEAIERGRADDADVRVYTDYETIRTVQRSDDPIAVVQSVADDGRLVYDGVGLANSLRYGGISFLL